jgi:hypothetical protein
MWLKSPDTNITGVTFVIDVIEVANGGFSYAEIKLVGIRKTIDIAMLLQDFLNNSLLQKSAQYTI